MSFNTRIPSRTRSTSADPEEGRSAVEGERWAEVEKLAKKRLRKSAIDSFSHRYLGLALQGLGQHKESLQAYERALKIYPSDVVVLINFSNILSGLGQVHRAYELSKRATQLAPGLARSWISLLWPCYMLSKHQEGVNAAERAKELPMSTGERLMLLNNLGTNLRDMGRLDEALAACHEAIALAPDWSPPYVNLMLFLQSKPDASAMEVRAAGELYASRFEAPWISQWPKFEDRNQDPHRRLRVGFLSPDFNCHSVMYFVEGFLSQLDRQQFEVHGIYLNSTEDVVTHRVMRHVDQFHKVSTLTDIALVNFIRTKEIDILVDLAGHTDRSGLRAMVHKPSPIQVSWIGFPGTTGLKSIDWRLSDEVTDQPGAEAEYTERLWRLPVLPAYRPLSRFPLYRYQPLYQVRPTPALTNGYVTYGSCNNLSKLTDQMLVTWANILTAVPNSRLLIEGKGLDEEQAVEDFSRKCAALGMDTNRLDLIARDSSQQYLTYHKIDVALDTFPLNGGTTSEDLLWMGLPLVTIQGKSFRSRMGEAILTSLGHTEWVAKDTEDYVRIAKELANDVDGLNTRRLSQRRAMEASPLMDEPGLSKALGVAFRYMWHEWCAKQQVGDDPERVSACISSWAQFIHPAPMKQITVAPGVVMGIHEAHTRLQSLTEIALKEAPREKILDGQVSRPPITHPKWLQVLEFAEFLLDSVPNEPLALATLAELEHAHGNTEFAATYLRYAQAAISQ